MRQLNPLFGIRAALFAAIAMLSFAISVTRADDARPVLGPRVIYVARHVEKAAEPKEDPVLSDAGTARAMELARTLGASGLEAIFVTNTRRSADSAKPLADQLGLVPIVYGADDPYGGARAALDSRARVALIFGHSDTVEAILEGLGLPQTDRGSIDFDDLFVVAITMDGKASVSRLKYGAPVAP